MAFKHLPPALCAREEEYPIDEPERFAAALEQFLWTCRPRTSTDAWNALETPVERLSTLAEKTPSSPLPFPHTTHTLQALQSVLDATQRRSCESRADPVTEAGLYLMRLTRLLEQRTLARVQSELALHTRESPPLFCASPPSPTLGASLADTHVSPDDRGRAPRGSKTVQSRGRRYTRPETSSSCCTSPSCVLDASALIDSTIEDKASSSMWRFHADLTLQLQQCMLRCMCLLDTALVDLSADDGGLYGILTHPRAVQLQKIFLDSICQVLSAQREKWRADLTSNGSTEAAREVAVALERLQQATLAQQQHGEAAPQLRVYELSTVESHRRSPPPFASRKQSPVVLQSLCAGSGLYETTGPAAPPGGHSDIEQCLGVAGCDYASKLVAQQLWCAQKTLSQRFPSYAAAWDLIEQARFFVESSRSPTPTVPRGDSNEHTRNSASAFGACASMTLHGSFSPERSLRHDGGTPPPCVTTTQRKSERPLDAENPESPPFRSLTYSEERSAGAEETGTEATATAVSPSRRPTASPPVVHHVTTSPRLLPVARCALWESFLAGHEVPASATLVAIQQLAAEADLFEWRRPLGSKGSSNTACENRVLHAVPLNQSRGEPGSQKCRNAYSIETAHCPENSSLIFSSKRAHARST